MASPIEELVRAMQEARYCAAFTGAGVSTFSGIPDFRGQNGLYNTLDADRVFDYFQFLEDPGYFYGQTRKFLYEGKQVKPSLVHTQLARLEKKGIVKALITQNIDMLHTKAGSRNVMEIHGSPAMHDCLGCHRKYSYSEVCILLQGKAVPLCPDCGGVLKPQITFFGEALPSEAFSRATEACAHADLLLVLGSSLLVQPAASLPMNTVQRGGTLVIINNMPTPLDRYAGLLFPDLEEVFSELTAEV
ncbi:MAG: NAD-dependent deacetylase [Spirochaetales bacterium]|nr:NAD-dependent deacetylase [Spirochaetales bacterium]